MFTDRIGELQESNGVPKQIHPPRVITKAEIGVYLVVVTVFAFTLGAVTGKPLAATLAPSFTQQEREGRGALGQCIRRLDCVHVASTGQEMTPRAYYDTILGCLTNPQ